MVNVFTAMCLMLSIVLPVDAKLAKSGLSELSAMSRGGPLQHTGLHTLHLYRAGPVTHVSPTLYKSHLCHGHEPRL